MNHILHIPYDLMDFLFIQTETRSKWLRMRHLCRCVFVFLCTSVYLFSSLCCFEQTFLALLLFHIFYMILVGLMLKSML